MSDKFTPAMALAAASLLENRGIGISKSLLLAVDQFNASNIVVACQEKLASSSTPADVISAIKALPYCLTGTVPRSMSAGIPASIKDQFDLNNLISDVKNQATILTSYKVIGLIGFINDVNQFCVTSFYLKGYMDEMKVARFRDFGFNINNYKDEITNGVNSQYSHLVGGISSDSYNVLFNQISNFGTLFDVTNLFGLNNPKALCVNLVNQGFIKVQSYLSLAGVDYDSIDTANLDKIMLALGNIRGADLKAILSVTNFTPYSALESLADVFVLDKILSPTAVIAAGGSLESLTNKLVNVGGDFTSFEDLKQTYLSIEDRELQYLNTFSDLVGNIEINSDNEQLGVGSDIFSNPTIFDCLGCLTGRVYTNEIETLISIQTKLNNSTLERDLLQALINNDSEKIAECKRYIDGNSELSVLVNQGNRSFRNIFKQLLIERKNLHSANIELTDPDQNIPTLYAFVVGLANAYDQLQNIGYVEFIKSIITDDPYGEAVAAVLVEGINNNLLSLKNIQSYVQLDPVAFARIKFEASQTCISYDPNDPNDLNNPNNPNSPNNPYGAGVTDSNVAIGEGGLGLSSGGDPNEIFTVIPNCANWYIELTAESFIITNENYNLTDQCVVWGVTYAANDCFTITPEFIYDTWCIPGKATAYEIFTLTEYPGQVNSTWTIDTDTSPDERLEIALYPLGQGSDWTIENTDTEGLIITSYPLSQSAVWTVENTTSEGLVISANPVGQDSIWAIENTASDNLNIASFPLGQNTPATPATWTVENTASDNLNIASFPLGQLTSTTPATWTVENTASDAITASPFPLGQLTSTTPETWTITIP
jgi:hypothetical protein